MVKCCVYKCSNRTDRGKRKIGIGFHCFPKDRALRSQWVRAIRWDNWAPDGNSRICTEHFAEDAVCRTYVSGPKLRENAVPTIFTAHPVHLQKSVKTRKPPKPRGVIAQLPATLPVGTIASPCSTSGLEQDDHPSNELEKRDEPPTRDFSVQTRKPPKPPEVLVELLSIASPSTSTLEQDDHPSNELEKRDEPLTKDFPVQSRKPPMPQGVILEFLATLPVEAVAPPSTSGLEQDDHPFNELEPRKPPKPQEVIVELVATLPIEDIASPSTSGLGQNHLPVELEPRDKPPTKDFSVQVDDVSTKRRLDALENQNKHLSWQLEQLNSKLDEKSRVIRNVRKENTRLKERTSKLKALVTLLKSKKSEKNALSLETMNKMLDDLFRRCSDEVEEANSPAL